MGQQPEEEECCSLARTRNSKTLNDALAVVYSWKVRRRSLAGLPGQTCSISKALFGLQSVDERVKMILRDATVLHVSQCSFILDVFVRFRHD